MPTYVYRCGKCGEDLEIWQSFDEKPKSRHAGGCGGRLTKVLQPAGIVLKGSGFYKTDSRTSGTKQSDGDGSSGDAKGSNGSSSTPSTTATGSTATTKDQGAKKPAAAS